MTFLYSFWGRGRVRAIFPLFLLIKNMYWDKKKFWTEYPGKKCSLVLFYQRVIKQWLSFWEAIKPHNKHIKWIVNWNGRTCTKCRKFKWWINFHVSKSSEAINHRTTQCIECRNAHKQAIRINKDFHEREIQYKRAYKQRPEILLRTKLDNQYYTNPIIKRNRKIALEVRKPDRETARMDKIYFHLNRGVSREVLKQAYGDFTIPVFL